MPPNAAPPDEVVFDDGVSWHHRLFRDWRGLKSSMVLFSFLVISLAVMYHLQLPDEGEPTKGEGQAVDIVSPSSTLHTISDFGALAGAASAIDRPDL